AATCSATRNGREKRSRAAESAAPSKEFPRCRSFYGSSVGWTVARLDAERDGGLKRQAPLRRLLRRSEGRISQKGTMAKKRVYELAKDLGLSNKEMVDWLRAHEYDVKSHSSSLEDDQAQAVMERIAGERVPKPVAAKPPSSGVVLRRKKADTLGPDGQPVGDHHEMAPPPPPAAPPPV